MYNNLTVKLNLTVLKVLFKSWKTAAKYLTPDPAVAYLFANKLFIVTHPGSFYVRSFSDWSYIN